MPVNFQKIVAASQFPGFRNSNDAILTGSIAGGTLTAGAFVSTTMSATLPNTAAISQVQIQYAGVTTEYFVLNGSLVYNPTTNYQIESLVSYSGTTLNVFTVVSNQTAGSITIPTITMTARAFLFLAPF